MTLRDVIAGVSVALVLVPQAVAYARLAGVPAHVGLYAAALPPLAAAVFASSPYLQTGPVAITSLLTFGALSLLAAPGSPEYVALGALLALLVGLIRVALGVFRLGYLVYLMSEPVVRGFTTGAALLIILSQLPGALGVEAGAVGVVGGAVEAVSAFDLWHPAAIALAAFTVAVVLGGQRVSNYLPGVMAAVLAGIGATLLLGYTGPTLGAVREGLPRLTLALPWTRLPELVLPAVVIALVGFSEAAAIARVFASRERQRWRPNSDFVSQGVANLAAGLSGAMPVGGSFARSSLNYLLGARSRWSGAITGAVVLLVLPFAGRLAPLPVAVLSGVVIAAVVPLVRIRPILDLRRLSRLEFLIATITLVLTLALAPRLDQAVILGILLAVTVHLWREFKVAIESWTEDDELHVRPRGVLWFASAEVLKGRILHLLSQQREARRLVVHMEGLGRVDLTAALVLEALAEHAEAAGVAVRLEGIPPHVDRRVRARLASRIPPPEPGGPEPARRADLASPAADV